MVGLANRPGGYSQADVQFLQPLLNTAGHLELARRAELARSEVESQLARTSALLAEKTRAPVRWKARWPAFPRASPAWMPPGTSVSTTGVI